MLDLCAGRQSSSAGCARRGRKRRIQMKERIPSERRNKGNDLEWIWISDFVQISRNDQRWISEFPHRPFEFSKLLLRSGLVCRCYHNVEVKSPGMSLKYSRENFKMSLSSCTSGDKMLASGNKHESLIAEISAWLNVKSEVWWIAKVSEDTAHLTSSRYPSIPSIRDTCATLYQSIVCAFR